MSNAEINRLGERLRASALVGDDDLALLQDLRREYESAMYDIQTKLAAELGPRSVTTSRLKTVQTLVGKLRREPSMDLAQVQDIAGIRVVGEMALSEQTDLCERISALFDFSKIVDRRSKPSHGYRAVHVVVKSDGRPIEVQVRTLMQDRWAQIVERMADGWGRQIRYGHPPDRPDEHVGKVTRAFVVGLVRRLSPIIDISEQNESARQLRVRGDVYAQQVAQVLAQLARLPALNSSQ